MNQIVFGARNLYDKARKMVGDPYLLGFYLNTYVFSRYKEPRVTSYVVSYPKCGRTWSRTTLRRYLALSGVAGSFDRDGNFVRRPGSGFLKFDEDQGAWIPAPLRIDQLRFNARKYRGKRVCFIARHPGDVLVSSWYHLTYRERIYTKGLSEFIREKLVGIEKVIAFMNMWMENREVPEAFHLATYEQLREDPVAGFSAMFAFVGVPMDSELLKTAIDDTSFKKMKEMELHKELVEPWMRIGAEKTDRAMKVRKGKVGGYKDELSKEDVDFLHQTIAAKLHPALPYGRQAASTAP